jgi:hypothetical protein
LKYDFAADSFCLRDFWMTEAALSMVMVAYNLMSLFRQATLRASVIQSGGRDVQHTLKTLRYSYLPRPAYHHHAGPNAHTQACSGHASATVDGGPLATFQKPGDVNNFV